MKTLLFAIIVCVSSIIYADTKKETTCRVQDVGGVPRLVLNGKPVRARMVYVSPLYFPMGSLVNRSASADAPLQTFVEIPELKEAVDGAAEIGKYGHFNAKIYSLEVVERETEKVVYKMNVDGDDRVRVNMGTFKFTSENGEKFLWVRSDKGLCKVTFDGVKYEAGKVYQIRVKIKGARGYTFSMYATKNNKFLEPQKRSFVGLQTKLAKDADVDFVTFPVQIADFMPEDGKSYNFENIKGALEEILQANPDAKILVRVRCYPPDWWINKYPADTFRNTKGELMKKYKGAGSTFSERFRKDCAKALSVIIDYCEKNYSQSIVGYHPGSGNSCEWFYPDVREVDWIGYEESAQVSWRKWLTKKYKTDANLQSAWNDPSVSLKTATVPLPEERNKAYCLIDPKTQMKLFDCNAFRQDAMVDTMLYLSKTIRKKVPNKLSVLFYGYVTITDIKGAANPGHFGLERVLASEYVDFLCGPLSYSKRDIGFGGMHPGSTESVTRAGKIWFVEDDIRTHRVPPSPKFRDILTQEDTLNILRRDLAQEAIRNSGNWFMDLTGTGWYDDPAFWALMKQFEKMDKDTIKNPIPYNPEVAIMFDERSTCYGGANNTNIRTMMAAVKTRADVSDLATPYGTYLLNDFLFGKPMSPKLAVVAVSCALDAKQRKALYEKTRNTSAVFVWTTGIIDADKREINLDYMREATGFEVEYAGDNISTSIIPTQAGKEAGLPVYMGTDKKTTPLFTPKLKKGDIVLGVYKENKKPAIVLRGKHMFYGIGVGYTQVFDYMYKVAGVHKYSKQNVCVFANGAYISVTCTDKNKSLHDIELDIPSDKVVYNALTGKKLGKAPKLILKMKRGDNIVLRLGKGNAEFVK